jgi:hypothetical protein
MTLLASLDRGAIKQDLGDFESLCLQGTELKTNDERGLAGLVREEHRDH